MVFAHVVEHVFQFCGLLFGQAHVAVFALTEEGDFARFFLVGQYHCIFACVRYVGQAEDFDRDRWAGFIDGFAVFVNHRTDFTECSTGQQHIAFFQRTALNQQCGNCAAAFVQTGFNDDTFGRCIDWGSQFQNFGFEQYGFEQCVDIEAFFGGNVDELYIAAPFVGYDFVCSQLLADTLRVGGFFIDFIDGNHHRYARRFRMGNGFDGLRHHAVVGCDHENHDIGCFRTARTHGGKRFVTRSIQEGNHAARGFNVVCTDVLGNAARFALYHFGAADVVQQGSFTVVNVTHYGHHRRARQCFGFYCFNTFIQECFRVVGGGWFTDVAEFLHHNQGSVLVDRLVDGYHHAHFHQGFNYFDAFNGHFVCQVGNGNGFRYQNFVYDRFGWRLESVLVGLKFEFFTFFTAAYAFFIAIACIVAVTAAFAAFAFGVTALVFFITITTVFFFTAHVVFGFAFAGCRFGFLGRFTAFA